MSNGGLLQKAIEQQSHDDGDTVVVADVANSEGAGMLSGSLKQGAGLGLAALLLSWLVASPGIQSDYAFAGAIPIVLFAGSFYLVWNAIDRKQTAVIAVVYVLLAASPYAAMSLFSGDITITDANLSDDSTQITLKIRESGAIFGSSADSADVTVTYDGSSVWESTMPFAIDRADGFGDYGLITLTTSDWYSGNSIECIKLVDGTTPCVVPHSMVYVVSVAVESSEDTMELNSEFLQRTVQSVKSSTAGAIGTESECSDSKDSCIIGVALTAWAGMNVLGDGSPGALPHADYILDATLYFGSSVAISYPQISVANGFAQWDSSNGEFGGGSASVGGDGSELSLPGSVESFELNTKYIPIDDWAVSDYGCYHFTVEVTQDSPWSDGSVASYTSYYDYTEEGGESDGNPTNEAWTSTTNCD